MSGPILMVVLDLALPVQDMAAAPGARCPQHHYSQALRQVSTQASTLVMGTATYLAAEVEQ